MQHHHPTLNTGALQGCVLNSNLLTLFMHDCVATHQINQIITFADDITIAGLFTNNEVAYRDEVQQLQEWCNTMVVDFRRAQSTHQPIHINGTSVEQMFSFRFSGVKITNDL